MMYVVIYSVFVFFFAWINSYWISEGRYINHFFNGLIHCFAAVVIGISEGWQSGVATLLATRAIFDAALNHFRYLGLGYIPPDPASKIDRWEKRFILWLSPKIKLKPEKLSIILKIAYFSLAILLCLIHPK